MRILTTIFVFDLILGAAMALYLVAIWHKYKGAIVEHGWDLNHADPICNNMWLLCFIPVIGIMYYLVAGETLGKLAVTDKKEANGIVSVYYGKLSFHYDEDHRM